MIKQDFQAEDQGRSFGGWLRNLQRESWQMELFVAGGSLAFLIALKGNSLAVYHALQYRYDFTGLATFLPFFGYAAVNAAITISIVHLSINLILRSFWIGIIGLRRSAHRQEIDQLPYHPVFRKEFLQRVIPPDELIQRIDRISSAIFGLTYLIAFYFISLMLTLACIFGCFVLVGWVEQTLVTRLPYVLFKIIDLLVDGIVLGFTILGVVYLFDFLCFGVLKRYKFTAWLYWPSYAIYSRITFARWYRSLFYGLLLGPRGRWVHPALSAYLVAWALVLSVGYQSEIYLPDNAEGLYAEATFYADELPDNHFLERGVIPSKTLTQADYLELFLPYRPSDHSLLAAQCPDYRPVKQAGYGLSGIRLSIGLLGIPIRLGQINPEPNPATPLNCLRSLYRLQLDSEPLPQTEPVFYRHPNQEELGILLMIPTDSLGRGRHTLHIEKVELSDDEEDLSPEFAAWQKIPFWVQ